MEPLKHECGVALVRLLKPLEYYQQKYGTWMYGLNKLYLMMEKQHNRGQEGAGLACVKMNAPAGEEYIYRERAIGNTAIQEIFVRSVSSSTVSYLVTRYPSSARITPLFCPLSSALSLAAFNPMKKFLKGN